KQELRAERESGVGRRGTRTLGARRRLHETGARAESKVETLVDVVRSLDRLVRCRYGEVHLGRMFVVHFVVRGLCVRAGRLGGCAFGLRTFVFGPLREGSAARRKDE